MKAVTSFTERCLKDLDKVAKLNPESQRLFWDQRHWHPLVMMVWNAETVSSGSGLITYPNGEKRFYTVPERDS